MNRPEAKMHAIETFLKAPKGSVKLIPAAPKPNHLQHPPQYEYDGRKFLVFTDKEATDFQEIEAGNITDVFIETCLSNDINDDERQEFLQFYDREACKREFMYHDRRGIVLASLDEREHKIEGVDNGTDLPEPSLFIYELAVQRRA